jgi:antitoxin component YwqK of YwqJK toxin-antitoxin module
MSADHYLFSQHELVISDPELGIDIAMSASLPRLTENLLGLGIVQEKDKEGNLLSAYLVEGGRRHGECRLFAEEGKLRAEMFYLHGKLHGPSVMYGEEAEVLAKTWYCDGKKVGKAHFYFPNGRLASVQRFKNGHWEGMQEYFYADGSTKSRIPFREGKLHGEVSLFWESGKPKRSVHYADNLREGADKLWNEQGILIDEGEYQKGLPVGLHRHYFVNGKVQEELHHHTPLRFDRREWDSNGKLLFEGTFASDLSYTERVFLEPHGARVRKGVWDGNRLRWK